MKQLTIWDYKKRKLYIEDFEQIKIEIHPEPQKHIINQFKNHKSKIT